MGDSPATTPVVLREEDLLARISWGAPQEARLAEEILIRDQVALREEEALRILHTLKSARKRVERLYRRKAAGPPTQEQLCYLRAYIAQQGYAPVPHSTAPSGGGETVPQGHPPQAAIVARGPSPRSIRYSERGGLCLGLLLRKPPDAQFHSPPRTVTVLGELNPRIVRMPQHLDWIHPVALYGDMALAGGLRATRAEDGAWETGGGCRWWLVA